MLQIIIAVTENKQKLELPQDLSTLRGGTFDGMGRYTALIDGCCDFDPARRPSLEDVIAELRTLLENATIERVNRQAMGNGASRHDDVSDAVSDMLLVMCGPA